jgi:hypothetical protein
MGFGGRSDDDDPIWSTNLAPVEETGGQEEYLELIGNRLRASGVARLGRFRRLTDYVNFLEGFFTLHDVTLLTRTGEATRITMPELRVRLDDVGIVGQHEVGQMPASQDPGLQIEKVQQRLVIMTRAHIVAGDVHVHAGGSLLHFVDSTDPKFIPMSDVRVRWLDDHAVVGHFAFALVQRSQILGVATEGLGGADEAERRREQSEAAVGIGATAADGPTADGRDAEDLA